MKDSLHQELLAAGAQNAEVNELQAMAAALKTLPAAGNRQPSLWRTLVPVGSTGVVGIVIGMALVILSQTVLPGSRLYAVQKLSDNLAVSVDPSYRGTIMMKRAQQVKQLVAQHASSHTVLAALVDYQAEASTYKSVPANYAVFEYCKTNLVQAASSAPASERNAITSTLNELQT